jgi:hypothetical protein
MVKKGSQDPAVASFIARLREFHEACGAPTYRSLVAVSRRLGDLYPDQVHAERDLPGLSVAAISEVLGGRRTNLPAVGWVVAFVLSCQRRAYETMVIPSDPGADVVPDWIRRLQAARAGAAQPPLAPTASGHGPGAEEGRAPADGARPPTGRVDSEGGSGRRTTGPVGTPEARLPPCGRECPAAPAVRPDERKARRLRAAVMQHQGTLGRGVWITQHQTEPVACR